MRINHNIAALNTFRQLSANNTNGNKSIEKLSSGLRINRAGDDAAGLAISEKMRSQIRGLEMASRNAQDGISLIQTAEGALNESHSILQRMRELAVQSANDTNTAADRSEIQKEIGQLVSELDRISSNTEFNEKKLLNGEAGVKVTSSNEANARGAIGDAETVAGTYEFTGFTLATAKEATTTKMFATADTALGEAGSLTINGTTFNFTTDNTAQNILDAVNAKSGTTGIIATLEDGKGITLKTAELGSSATFDVKADGAFTGMGATSGGIDAIATGGAGSYVANGNHIEYISGDMTGLSFTVAGTGAATLTVDTNNALKMHIGANANQDMSISINDMSATALGVKSIDVSTQENANLAINTINTAIERVSSERAKLGAYQNRLEHTINNLGTSAENLTAAESRIRDVDMAKEMMEFTKNSILAQAAQAMLAQANQQPQGVLQLLR